MYCDKRYAMKEGRIVGSGTPKALLTREFISEVYEVDAQIYHGKTIKSTSFTILESRSFSFIKNDAAKKRLDSFFCC